MTVDAEHLALALGHRLGIESLDPAHDEPGGDVLGLRSGGEGGGISATSASEIQRCSSSSQIASEYLIATHFRSGIREMAATTPASIRAVMEKWAFLACDPSQQERG